ncbi:hypothetical protein SAMN04488059_113110 [Devosia psychrophila]|uniref:Uncharacterized protein n=1 Tax=Devosia psychrophila TaxID=728005 RepID=A0A1I1MU75_9HYPH|nr:hypothetical protein SAMN04488059_113110 [Devosia psychrophila]
MGVQPKTLIPAKSPSRSPHAPPRQNNRQNSQPPQQNPHPTSPCKGEEPTILPTHQTIPNPNPNEIPPPRKDRQSVGSNTPLDRVPSLTPSTLSPNLRMGGGTAMSTRMDEAFASFNANIENIRLALASATTEADARFRSIDEMLKTVLKWQHDKVKCEPRTSVGYADYTNGDYL